MNIIIFILLKEQKVPSKSRVGQERSKKLFCLRGEIHGYFVSYIFTHFHINKK
jgi:hypothetical protein